MRLPEINLELPLQEIYDRLDVPSGLMLLPEDRAQEPDAEPPVVA